MDGSDVLPSAHSDPVDTDSGLGGTRTPQGPFDRPDPIPDPPPPDVPDDTSSEPRPPTRRPLPTFHPVPEPDVPPPPEPTITGLRRSRTSRGIRTRRKRAILPGLGYIAWNKDDSFTAFCSRHTDCTRSKVAHSGPKKGQGRPLGALFAWLSLTHQLGPAPQEPIVDKASHQKGGWPLFADRLRGRRELRNLENGPFLLGSERPKNTAAGEGSEPEEFE